MTRPLNRYSNPPTAHSSSNFGHKKTSLIGYTIDSNFADITNQFSPMLFLHTVILPTETCSLTREPLCGGLAQVNKLLHQKCRGESHTTKHLHGEADTNQTFSIQRGGFPVMVVVVFGTSISEEDPLPTVFHFVPALITSYASSLR